MTSQLRERLHLSAKGMLGKVRDLFKTIPDPESGPGCRGAISLPDCLMSALAIFGMKYPSMLQFDEHKEEETIRHNLKTLYRVRKAPCDTYLRTRLDEVDPKNIRGAFKEVFALLQRGKALERYRFIDEYFLLLSDGTGYFSSKSISCPNCCTKHHRDGSVTYHHMMLGAVIAHPDLKTVIPLCPEPIIKQDGAAKNDCERNASKRLIADLRREHPHLPLILAEDGLASNAPHLRMLQQHDISFITVVKPDGNASLFEWLKGVKLEEVVVIDKETGERHLLKYYNKIPLNNTKDTLEVNYLAYWSYDKEGKQLYHNSWVTDLKITHKNAFSIARGGRARWKIENETFNTLKNQGYNFEHNYGHGNKNLANVLGLLMMLAFLIDQAQQLCCGLFQRAFEKLNCKKKNFWERIRAIFLLCKITSWEALFTGIINGYGAVWEAVADTS